LLSKGNPSCHRKWPQKGWFERITGKTKEQTARKNAILYNEGGHKECKKTETLFWLKGKKNGNKAATGVRKRKR